jgi:hypothetical protein
MFSKIHIKLPDVKGNWVASVGSSGCNRTGVLRADSEVRRVDRGHIHELSVLRLVNNHCLDRIAARLDSNSPGDALEIFSCSKRVGNLFRVRGVCPRDSVQNDETSVCRDRYRPNPPFRISCLPASILQGVAAIWVPFSGLL